MESDKSRFSFECTPVRIRGEYCEIDLAVEESIPGKEFSLHIRAWVLLGEEAVFATDGRDGIPRIVTVCLKTQ